MKITNATGVWNPVQTFPSVTAATASPRHTPKVPGEGGGDNLPKTGVAVGGLVGGAALLLALGVGLFLLARRRRVTFTA